MGIQICAYQVFKNHGTPASVRYSPSWTMGMGNPLRLSLILDNIEGSFWPLNDLGKGERDWWLQEAAIIR
jgi:hypothetical protein